jgi:mono/diheme cytochrome c family protein
MNLLGSRGRKPPEMVLATELPSGDLRPRLAPKFLLRLAPLVCFLLPACQQEMAMQPSGRPDEGSSFFSDEREARPLVPGTVARGHLRTDRQYYTGKSRRPPEAWQLALSFVTGGAAGNVLGGLALAADAQGSDVEEFPFPVTHDVLELGRQRYMIYCVVCHDPLGKGRGKIVERGYTQPPSYHIDRLRTVAVGHFFDVITNGYGSMPDYKQQIPPRDRWAIAAYIRALQLSQHFPAGDVTEEMRAANAKQDHAEGQP